VVELARRLDFWISVVVVVDTEVERLSTESRVFGRPPAKVSEETGTGLFFAVGCFFVVFVFFCVVVFVLTTRFVVVLGFLVLVTRFVVVFVLDF
jgi:hypothetical protein